MDYDKTWFLVGYFQNLKFYLFFIIIVQFLFFNLFLVSVFFNFLLLPDVLLLLVVAFCRSTVVLQVSKISTLGCRGLNKLTHTHTHSHTISLSLTTHSHNHSLSLSLYHKHTLTLSLSFLPSPT